MKKKSLIMATCVALALVLGLAGAVWAKDAKPACGTQGPLKITDLAPSGSYTYQQNSPGGTSATFTVSSPDLQINNSCDSSLPYVYGNGASGADIVVDLYVGTITNFDDTPLTLDSTQLAALTSAFSFTPNDFPLTSPGNGANQLP